MYRFYAAVSALVVVIALVVPAVEPASAQTGGRPGVTSTTINVGGIAGVTNPVGQPYASGFDGVQAYFNYVNAKGGVFGRKFKLVARLDDQSRASQNVTEARSLVEEKHVFAVLPVVTQILRRGLIWPRRACRRSAGTSTPSGPRAPTSSVRRARTCASRA